jgi:hypothetical protein
VSDVNPLSEARAEEVTKVVRELIRYESDLLHSCPTNACTCQGG